MGHRNKQHMGRSVEDEREMVGRDVRAGDETADRASANTVPMPNEEGTDFRAGQPEDAGRESDDARDEERGKDPRQGGGSRETRG